MTAEEIINITCDILKVDISIVTGKKLKRDKKDRYRGSYKIGTSSPDICDARFIATFLIRKHLGVDDKKITYETIALLFSRVLKSGVGDHALALYWDWQCGELLKSKNKAFIAKYALVEIEILKLLADEIPDANFKRKKY